jgi:biopolymer transport protein ExbD
MIVKSGGGLQSDINVTPLVDVVLVLLIIFMVIVPLTLRGYDVDIPGQSTVETSEEKLEEQVVLSIDRAGCPAAAGPLAAGLPQDCRVGLNDESLAVAELSRRIGEIFASRQEPERVLFLAPDGSLNYEAVMRIVDAARAGTAGLRIGLVTAEQA